MVSSVRERSGSAVEAVFGKARLGLVRRVRAVMVRRDVAGCVWFGAGEAVKVRLGMVWNVMRWFGVVRQSWCDRVSRWFGQAWSGVARQSWWGGAGLG